MKNNTRMNSAPARQRGIGMIEVMVAVLILAIGVLGIAALQAITLKNTGSSASRTQAAVQVYSMMDIIRADRGNLAAYNTNIYVAGELDKGDPGSMEGWLGELKRTVAPDAMGRVVCVADSMTCTVGVQWNDTRATGGIATEQVEVASQL
ncbi:type IV pilus modification protein PilV [Stenotrophomonas sp. Iso1]|uniref:type IV pilus modification protein PilV n=1 Tax=Stenotrophomonas sp. Iso1 TaxID=2977283 RepID=UPI0022B7CA05|nr:type IV pilus modification protein PilV [Stenotrophomonas sp. Iso1]